MIAKKRYVLRNISEEEIVIGEEESGYSRASGFSKCMSPISRGVGFGRIKSENRRNAGILEISMTSQELGD